MPELPTRSDRNARYANALRFLFVTFGFTAVTVLCPILNTRVVGASTRDETVCEEEGLVLILDHFKKRVRALSPGTAALWAGRGSVMRSKGMIKVVSADGCMISMFGVNNALKIRLVMQNLSKSGWKIPDFE